MQTHHTQIFNEQAGYLVPCLDVKDGHTLQPSGIPGLQDPNDAVAVAKYYSDTGGAKLYLDIFDPYENENVFLPLVENIARAINIPMTVMVQNGIIRGVEDVKAFLDAGANSYAINTSAIEHPDWVSEATARYGHGCILGVINAKRVALDRWEPYTHGGVKSTGLDAVEWVQELVSRGASYILVNSMDTENTGIGFELDLTRAIAEAVSVPVIASGGAGSLEHLYEGLTSGRAAGVLVNSMFHTGRIPIAEAKAFLGSRMSQRVTAAAIHSPATLAQHGQGPVERAAK